MSATLVQTSPPLPADINERRSKAFKDLEGTIRDVDRMARIAANLTMDADGGSKDEIELAAFATYQTEEMTKQLVAKYYRLFEKARKT
jgi:hypothetical protein